ncbi:MULTISPECIES: hypothetical protein [Pseudomonas]|uniref:hypothetical protein n=1 Tax=Pseudomonas TaxID=286 RepID=UPI00117AC1FD|nr:MULTISPECIES: hypothetical protein [Pseudomonas]
MTGKNRAFSIHELLVALLRDQNIHEGYYGLTVQFEAHGTALTLSGRPESNLPGLTIAVSGVTLISVADNEPGSVDASVVNPIRSEIRVRKQRGSKILQ